MPVDAILMRANPVTDFEQFSLNLNPSQFNRESFKHRDMGGDWSCRFRFEEHMLDRVFASEMLVNGCGRDLRFYNEKGIIDWRGFVKKVVLDTGTARIERDLDTMVNRAWMRYNSAGTPTRSTKISNMASQNRYGIKERVRIGGDLTLAVADQHIQKLIDRVAFPTGKMRIRVGRSRSRQPSMEIFGLGYWHTLAWRIYAQTASTGDGNASVVVEAVVDDVGEFIRTKAIDTNTSPIPQEFDSDMEGDNIVVSIAEVGDGSFQPWVVGVSGDREFYYRQAARATR